MKKSNIFLLFIAFVSILIMPMSNLHANTPPATALAEFHQSILKRYPDVAHISTKTLAALSEQEILLFDVRKQSEYDVSHLKSAIRVSPKMSADSFLRQYRNQLNGKKVIFYCSVGERSSKLAQALTHKTPAASIVIYNLEGGIFKWHNESRPVFNHAGETNKIHPYNKFWGRLISHQKHIHKK